MEHLLASLHSLDAALLNLEQCLKERLTAEAGQFDLLAAEYESLKQEHDALRHTTEALEHRLTQTIELLDAQLHQAA